MTSHGMRNFPQNLEISSKMSLFWLPISVIFATFFEPFPKKGPQGSRATPKSAQKTQNGPQGCPNGAQGCHNGAPRSPQIHKKPPKCAPRVTKWTPGCHNGAPRSPKVLKRRYKVSQSATERLKCGPRCQKNDIPTYRHIPSKIHDIFFKCRRQCFAHQYIYIHIHIYMNITADHCL